ncbi:MAG: hypothetical protein ABUL49_00375, partial [bacterium]
MALSFLGAAGCRPKVEVPYTTYFKDVPAYVPVAGSKNAFDDYLTLGSEAMTALEEPQTATYSPGFKEVMAKKALPLLQK